MKTSNFKNYLSPLCIAMGRAGQSGLDRSEKSTFLTSWRHQFKATNTTIKLWSEEEGFEK